jgi:hypothetical protein
MASERITKAEAIERIKKTAQQIPGGDIRFDGLGYRREGVPGTGGGTFAVSYSRGTRRRKDGKNYIQIDFC